MGALVKGCVQLVVWVRRERIEIGEGVKQGVMCVRGCAASKFAACDILEARMYFVYDHGVSWLGVTIYVEHSTEVFRVGCLWRPGSFMVGIVRLCFYSRLLWGLCVKIPGKAYELRDNRTRRRVVDIHTAFFGFLV